MKSTETVAVLRRVVFTYGTNVVFCGPHLPLAFLFFAAQRRPVEGFSLFGYATAVQIVVLRPRNTVQIVVFDGGPLVETILPYGM